MSKDFLACAPVSPHPHWDTVLTHIGTELTSALRKKEWAQQHGITTGAQYLTLWIASMFREPLERTPYLFLHGSEGCGKSIFYESIKLLMKKDAVVNAHSALSGGFNSELMGAMLCYIEEVDLSKHSAVQSLIKDWCVADSVTISQMRKDSYSIPNKTHWVQIANSRSYGPTYGGSARVTTIRVPDLAPDQRIAKEALKQGLRNEAPHILHTLLNVSLPDTVGRMCIPAIDTGV